MTLTGAIDGAFSLSLSSGTGNLSLLSNVGATTRLAAFTITQTGNATTQSITAANIVQLGGSGTSAFGTLDTNTASGIALTGTGFTFNGTVDTTALGPMILQNSGTAIFNVAADTTLAGVFTQTGPGMISLSSTISAVGDITIACPLTAIGSGELTATGAISLLDRLEGPGNITFNPGTNITVAGDAGGVTRIGVLTVSSAQNVDFKDVSANSILQSAGTGTTTINGDLNTNAVLGISLTDTNLSLIGEIITTSSGPLTLNHTGTLSINSSATTSVHGSISETGTGGVSLAGTMASNAGISFDNAITLTNNTTISTVSGGGNIVLSDTIDGAQNLILAAGAGNITLSGAIGATTRVANFTIQSANNASAQNITA